MALVLKLKNFHPQMEPAWRVPRPFFSSRWREMDWKGGRGELRPQIIVEAVEAVISIPTHYIFWPQSAPDSRTKDNFILYPSFAKTHLFKFTGPEKPYQLKHLCKRCKQSVLRCSAKIYSFPLSFLFSYVFRSN